MKNSRADFTAIFGVALAGAITVAITDGDFDGWDTIVGLTLISILLTHDFSEKLGKREIIAFSATWGLTILITIGIFWSAIIGWFKSHFTNISDSMFIICSWIIMSFLAFIPISLLAKKE